MSAQTDRFVHDRLPPRNQWPRMHYDLPELQLPAQLNAIGELLDKAANLGKKAPAATAPAEAPASCI